MRMHGSLQRFSLFCFIGIFLLLAMGCTRHVIESKSQVDLAPIELKPIHITIDVNIKVDRELDEFFGDLDEAKGEIQKERIEAESVSSVKQTGRKG
jgi:hypothetical protein